MPRMHRAAAGMHCVQSRGEAPGTNFVAIEFYEDGIRPKRRIWLRLAIIREVPMKSIALAAAFCIVAGSAFAQGMTCKSLASDKKLAGAALNSFMKKCETDAQKTCTIEATGKKLAGAAKNSFTKKCVGDAVGI
jgi:hypothetical protein